MNGKVWRATDGGASHDSWSDNSVWEFGWATMTQPVVTTPYNPDTPAEAGIVAVGAGNLVFVSPDFGTTWPMNQRIDLGANSGDAFALAFASPDRLFIGTATGQVFRADRNGNGWSLTRIDDAAAGPLGVAGLISDIGVDWGDGTLNSIYVAFGGAGAPPCLALRRRAVARSQRPQCFDQRHATFRLRWRQSNYLPLSL
jgi:hypothetical protein